MSLTSNFVRQHDDILKVASEIGGELETLELNVQAERIDKILLLLTRLAGKLTAHLTMEDNVLYPKLYEHNKPEVQAKAKEFFNEMGALRSVFETYIDKWMDKSAIENDSQAFIGETQGLFTALQERIDRENHDLYPLASDL